MSASPKENAHQNPPINNGTIKGRKAIVQMAIADLRIRDTIFHHKTFWIFDKKTLQWKILSSAAFGQRAQGWLRDRGLRCDAPLVNAIVTEIKRECRVADRHAK